MSRPDERGGGGGGGGGGDQPGTHGQRGPIFKMKKRMYYALSSNDKFGSIIINN